MQEPEIAHASSFDFRDQNIKSNRQLCDVCSREHRQISFGLAERNLKRNFRRQHLQLQILNDINSPERIRSE